MQIGNIISLEYDVECNIFYIILWLS